MIDRNAMAQMRCAAAVAHAVPTVGVVLASEGKPLVIVSHQPDSDIHGHAAICTLTPCEFRQVVASAWAQLRAGHTIGCRGLPTQAQIQVEFDVLPCDLALGLGFVRTTVADRWIHLTALPFGSDVCRAVVGDRRDIGVHHDPQLDATILHVESPLGAPDASDDLALLQDTAIACSMQMLDSELRSGITGRQR